MTAQVVGWRGLIGRMAVGPGHLAGVGKQGGVLPHAFDRPAGTQARADAILFVVRSAGLLDRGGQIIRRRDGGGSGEGQSKGQGGAERSDLVYAVHAPELNLTGAKMTA